MSREKDYTKRCAVCVTPNKVVIMDSGASISTVNCPNNGQAVVLQDGGFNIYGPKGEVYQYDHKCGFRGRWG